MNFVGTRTIETERFILRRARMDDAEAMFANWTGDPEVTKYLTWPTHASVEVTRSYRRLQEKNYADPKHLEWIISKKENDEPVGSIAIVKIDEEIDAVEIGYCLGRKYWGQGVMTEALGTVINFCFETLGANRVSARHDTNNPASGAVMRKCGMTFEGILRQADKNNQGICDAAIYSILASERR